MKNIFSIPDPHEYNRIAPAAESGICFLQCPFIQSAQSATN
jgi:hypothetical protein